MKRLISVVLLISIVIGILPVFAVADNTQESASDTADESAEFYPIYSKADLEEMRHNFTRSYILMADIIFQPSDFEEGGAYYNDGHGWEAIYLSNSFNGNNHTISGLKTDRGLFDIGRNASVYDLTLTDVRLFASESRGCTGAIASSNYGEIRNCVVDGTFFGNVVLGYRIGGIAGSNDGIIEGCKNIEGTILCDNADGGDYGYGMVGGIVGDNSGYVVNCENYSSILLNTKGGMAGGIAGENGGTIDSCENYGDLESRGSIYYLGGIVGEEKINYNCVISNSVNNGNIKFVGDNVPIVGGIAGRACGIVEYCTNKGSLLICTEGHGYIGGIAGQAMLAVYGDTSIRRCFNYSDVEVSSENTLISVGGIVGIAEKIEIIMYEGEFEGGFEVIECYNSGEVKGPYASMEGGIIGSICGSFDTLIIERCCNVGEIKCFADKSYLPIGSGGIIGTIQPDATAITVKDVYNLGLISLENEDNITYACSGLIGYIDDEYIDNNDSNITAINSYNMGNIIATENEVGTSSLIGCIDGSPTGSIDNLYYLKSGLSAFGFSDATLSIGNIKELTIEEFADEASFTGFDFDTVWAMSETNGYPYLQALGEGVEQPDLNALRLLYQYPQKNATGIVNTTAHPLSITMTFNKEVESVADSGDGRGYFEIYRQLEDDIKCTLVYRLSDKDSEVQISGRTVTIDVSKADFVNNSTYYVLMGPNVISFKDTDETISFSGTQWKFKTSTYAQGDYIGMYGSTFSYDDSYFLGGNSDVYNHDLALASCNLAIAAFNSEDAKASEYQADIAGSTVKNMLMQLDFAEDDIEISSYEGKPTKNSIAAAIASKKMNLNNEEWTLIAVAVRGGGYESEWGGNFVLNDSGKHAGFNFAANQVYEYLELYVRDRNIRGNIAIWITGYSRGAATANLLAAKLNNGYLSEIDRDIDPDNIFTYTFETPMGEVDSNANRYSNIFSIVNPIDIVPMVAPSKWNFTRNGIDCYLPSSQNTSRYGNYLQQAGEYYTAYTGRNLPEEFIKYQLNVEVSMSEGLRYYISNDINGPTHLQANFLNYAINTDLCTDLIPSRQTYYEDVQILLSEFVVLFLGDVEVNKDALKESILRELADTLFEWIEKECLNELTKSILGLPISEIYNIYNKITDHDKKEIAESLASILINSDMVHASIDELSEDIYKLFNIKELLMYAILHFEDLYTLIVNLRWIAVAHEPQFCLAWMNTVNDGFMSNENHKKTRYLTVNCPVDLQVYDSEGVLMASIVNGQIVRIENSTIDAYIDANEQKIVALPADETYQIEITATDIGTMTYSVSEYDFSQGATTRLVNYYELPLENGTTYSGIVEALEGNEANYPLKKGSGEYLPVSEELNGEEVVLYAVAADVVGNGIASGGGWFHRGEYAKITALSDVGENFLGWYVNGECVSTDAEYRFLVTEDTTVSAHFTSYTDDASAEPSTSHVPSNANNSASEKEESHFSDTSASDWYYTAVQYVAENGLMNGISSTQFAPNATLTRAMLVQVLYNLEGKPAVGSPSGFADVAPGAWYADAVAWAAEQGIVTGYSETRFGPDDAVTREQVAAIFQRYAKFKGLDADASGSLEQFTDDGAVSAYAKDAVIWAVDTGLLSGKGNGTLDPAGTATRAEIAAILMRFCENVLK